MKRFISLFMIFTLLISSCIFVYADESAEDTRFFVKIVHTNDIHARIVQDDWNGIIGLSKLKSIIKQHISGSDINLVLDSGDFFHGQSIATLVEGESTAQLMGAFGYDAMSPGNHDWNYGKDRLKELITITKNNDEKDFKLLAGNVINDDSTPFFDDDYLIKSIEKEGKELKIGIFGMIDPLIYESTAPDNVSGLSFTDMEDYAKKAVNDLKREGCQFIIALTHCYTPTELAARIDGVDLWLTGHEHISLNDTVMTPNGKETLVIQNGYYLYEAGLINIDLTLNNNSEITSINCTSDVVDYTASQNILPDNDILNLITQIQNNQAEILNKIVGYSPVDLDGVWEHLRIDETAMGRALTDAYLLETNADVSFENAGGIRSSINKGNVTYGDIINVLPFGNYIVTKQVTGGEILEILETSIDIQIKSIAANDSGIYDAWPENSGSYLQTGGMTVKYNFSNDKGSRVQSVLIGESPLQNDRIYTIAVNNFLSVSSDYPQIANKKVINEYCACDEALITFFKQSEEYISKSVLNARMIQNSDSADNNTENNNSDNSNSVDKNNDETTVISKPTNKTEDTSATSTPVPTGDEADKYVVILITMLSMTFIFVLISKRKTT